ncbi:hypothetical protein [Tenacibaculum sp. M341]|uniref:hypothetical protein n=1 Tax=Tenacibaculum sp. M341 TaxID=2530339 RepID=UPI00104FEAF1|nr:hypothetical protein [Tenacibaculum sp. M341]TCI85081.1 hypothetical protein EYW44_18170 [Tenacibaculum sp. M341]
MELIIIPFLFGAFILGVFSIVKIIRELKSKKIEVKEILLGGLTSIAIFGAICLSYLCQEKVWVLSHGFIVPIFMFYLPFMLYLIATVIKKNSFNYISKIMMISVGISLVLLIIFNDYYINLIDYLGVSKYY